MQIRDIMQSKVVTVTPNTSLAQAHRQMSEHRIRHLPVLDGVSLVGVVSDRDLRDAFPSLATTLSPSEIHSQMDVITIKSCMTPDVVTISPGGDPVRAGSQLLGGAYSCLPVVDHEGLVGMVTDIDFLRGFMATAAPAGDLLPVKDYMHPTPHTVECHTLVSAARECMLDAQIRHLPVIEENGRVIGLLTDRDIRQASASAEPDVAVYEPTERLEQMTVKEAMTAEVITVGEETPVGDAGQLLLDHRFGCLPVTRDNKVLSGIITVIDLIRAYVAQHEEMR